MRILKKQIDESRRTKQKSVRLRTESDAFPTNKGQLDKDQKSYKGFTDVKTKLRTQTPVKEQKEDGFKEKVERDYAKIRNLTN